MVQSFSFRFSFHLQIAVDNDLPRINRKIYRIKIELSVLRKVIIEKYPNLGTESDKLEEIVKNIRQLDEIVEKINSVYDLETRLYFEEGMSGGYSGLYVRDSWDEDELISNSDSNLFEKLAEFDIQNGADPSRLLFEVCLHAAFHCLEVKNNIFKI